MASCCLTNPKFPSGRRREGTVARCSGCRSRRGTASSSGGASVSTAAVCAMSTAVGTRPSRRERTCPRRTAPPVTAQATAPRGGRKGRGFSSGTDPMQPWAKADGQPRPAKRGRVAVDHGESAPSTVSAAGRSPATHALYSSTGRYRMTPAGRHSWPGWRRTRWCTATATCHGAGPRTRGWASGSATSGRTRRRWGAATSAQRSWWGGRRGWMRWASPGRLQEVV